MKPGLGRCVAAALALSVSAPAGAQHIPLPAALYGTMEVKSESSTSGGNLTGCNLAYRTLIRDWIHRQGQASIVIGKFGVALNEAGVAQGHLKVVVSDLSPGDKDLVATPNRPQSIYLTSEGHNTLKARISQRETEPAGALSAVFELDAQFLGIIEDVLNTERVNVMFAREKNGQDVPVELELKVTGTDEGLQRVRSSVELEAFAKCLARLLS